MRQKMTHSLDIMCPVCKMRSKVKVKPVAGFSGKKLCEKPECRFRFEYTFKEVSSEGRLSISYMILGVQAKDRVPWKGLLQAQRSKVSGDIVLVYKTVDVGLDSNKQYTLICVKHDTGNYCRLDSFKEVLTYQGKPQFWCDECKAEHGE